MSVIITDSNAAAPRLVQWEVNRVLKISGTSGPPTLRFANQYLDHALPVKASADGDDWTCVIPNIMLQYSGAMVVSVFVQGEEGIVEATVIFPVLPAVKPLDYEYEDNVGYIDWEEKSAEVQAIIDSLIALRDSGQLKGDDGFSPVITVTTITGGHRVSITDATGTKSFDVMDAEGSVTVDDALSSTSENPVQNKVIKTALDAKGTYSKPSGGIPKTDLASAVQTSLGKADSAYQKPSAGIPKTDLVSAVQTSLGKADTAYQKPSGGIPKTDLASAVQSSLDLADSALQSYTETDPTVPSWAKASTKPTYSKSEVGLGNVDNTSDANKPISTATQTALNGKADVLTEQTISTAGAVTQALTSGVLYHFTGALTNLTITLTAPASGVAHYHFDFLAGTTAPTLTMPSTVTMPDDFTVEASRRYEVDVLGNYGAVVSWAI